MNNNYRLWWWTMMCVPGVWYGGRAVFPFISHEAIIFFPSSYLCSSVSYLPLRLPKSFPDCFSGSSYLIVTCSPHSSQSDLVKMQFLSCHCVADFLFFFFTLLLGESQNHYFDFLSRLCVHWPQLSSATSPNSTLPHALVFESHLHCLVPWANPPILAPTYEPLPFTDAIILVLLIFCV